MNTDRREMELDETIALLRAAGDADEEVREGAVAALEEMGPPPSESVPELADLLHDANTGTAYWSATLLGRLGEAAAASVPSLMAAAVEMSKDLAVRERCVIALGRIGPPASAALPLLRELLKNVNQSRLSRLARESLEKIGK